MIQDITESMSENLLHITSYTGLVLFHDLKEEQIPQIFNITNKKRKKDNTSELRNSAKKKTKVIQDDNNDKKYFLTSKNININKWYDNLKKVKEYIDIYNKKPAESDKDEEIQKLGKWISLQQLNYNKKAMKDENIYSEWSQFTIEYHKYFLNIHDKWYNSLNEVKK